MPDIHNLVLWRHGKAGSTGYKYDAIFDGRVLCTSRDPEHSACRALLQLGLRGEARFWYPGRSSYHFRMRDIEVAAGYFASEGSRGLRLLKYDRLAAFSPPVREAA